MFSFFKRFRGSKAAEGTPVDAQADVSAEVQSEPAQQPADVAETRPPQEAAARVTPAAAPVAAPAPVPSARQPEAAPPQQRPAVDIPAPAPAPTPAPPAVTPPTVAAPPVATAPAAMPAPAPTQAAAQQATASAAQSSQADDESVETVEIVPPPAPEPEAKKSWLSRLRSGLSKTSSNIAGIFVATKIDEELYEELETALLMSDAGVEATEFLLESLREKVRTGRLTDAQQVKTALRGLLVDLLKPLEKSLVLGRAQPLVMMIAGVNGAGKTTSIGKLAKHLQRFDQSVLLAAGDTFRAAAREQLAIWGERNNVTVVAQESGDPAAVIFDAVGAARARKIDVLMADTAGRLPTQLHLMEELRKVKRVIGKALDGAPHEVLLVIDANTGQNALAQVKAFDDALGLTGLIVTKLDGTAKGGILAAIARQRPVPVYFIGVGEKVEDLQPFSAEEFADALLGA
ncbi:signal recognition particle receptor [Paraburkholderia kururiensis]|uniref:signal recognition particle-docking protein FtsY n=1 Tax=Paraburkholderia kururiensis TaxID=984307 RepID=UPI0039A63E6D